MRVIIAGAGEVGRGVAAALRQERRSVALIDPDPSAINESQYLDCLLITGSALSRDSLMRAGISDAEILIMATNDDMINLLGCSFAKKVYSELVGERNATGLRTIANINDPGLEHPSRGAGPLSNWTRADQIVSAADEIVGQLAASLLAPSIDEILPLGESSWIASTEVTNSSALIGTTTGEVGGIFAGMPSIYSIKKADEKGSLTKGDEIIEHGDILVFVSNSTDQFAQITRSVGKSDPDLKEKAHIAVFGASQFGVRLSDYYLRRGHSVVVIEPELDLANELVGSSVGNSKRLDVIHGDPQDEDLLRELDIHSHDIAVAALEDDNLNIAIAMRAKDKGVLRTGLVLRDKALVDAVHRIGSINPVSRRQVVVTGILKSIHMNVPGTFQVIPNVPEVISISAEVKAEQGIEGWPISKVESKIGARIAMIDREDFDGKVSVLDPGEVETVLLGDRLYILLLKADLKKLEKILGS